MMTASDTEQVPLVIVPKLQVRTITQEGMHAIVCDLPSRAHIDGLLGLNFLKQFDVCFKFSKGILEIHST